MFIGRYSLSQAYSETYWATGDDIEDVLADLEEQTGVALRTEEITWFRATPVSVKETRDYVILEL